MARTYSYQGVIAFTTLFVAIGASTTWLYEVLQVKRTTKMSPGFDLVTPLAVALGAQTLGLLLLWLRASARTIVFDFLALGCLLHAVQLHSLLLFSDWTSLKSRGLWYTAARQSWLSHGIFQWVATILSTIAFTSLCFVSIPFLKR
jgi:hypothetical protein